MWTSQAFALAGSGALLLLRSSHVCFWQQRRTLAIEKQPCLLLAVAFPCALLVRERGPA